jgi:hypothetical protein
MRVWRLIDGGKTITSVAKYNRPVTGSSVTEVRNYALRSPTRLPSVTIMGKSSNELKQLKAYVQQWTVVG